MYIKEINIKSRVYSYYFDHLINAKKLEMKNILNNKKKYKDLVIYFTRYDRGISIRMLSLYYDELMGKIEEDKGRNT